MLRIPSIKMRGGPCTRTRLTNVQITKKYFNISKSFRLVPVTLILFTVNEEDLSEDLDQKRRSIKLCMSVNVP